MRIAAGVLLILVAVIDLVAGLGYVVAGGAAGIAAKSSGGSLTEAYDTEVRRQGKEMSAEDKAQAAKVLNTVTTNAGLLAGFGAFLLVVVGLSIAGAVQLFRGKGAMFVMVAAVLVVAAEIISAVILKFGFRNVPGLVAAVFAFIGARSMMTPKPAVAPPGSPAPM
jgi:hypothetical protein